MFRKIMLTLVVVFAAATGANSQVVVDSSEEIGPIKRMNAVNNGPRVAPANQRKGNFEAYKAAAFPYARLHDTPLYTPWTKCVDIDCVFPDFDADETRAESYDFTLTDKLLAQITATGTRVFYRLGQSIEHASKKYEVYPPKDYKKWARICEHIIRHYNEGWADGFHYGIEYWEIWNEPDLGFRSGRYLKDDSPTWNGSDMENIQSFEKKNELIKKLLDRYGYSDVEMILDEWNYLSNWTNEYVYTTEVIGSYLGAAFCSAVMQVSQDGPVDMLMYYDARPNTSFNGLFDFTTFSTLPSYYSFYAWKRLREMGTQVFSCSGDLDGVYVTAAKGDNGRLAILVTHYSDDKNKIAPVSFDIELKNTEVKEIRSFVTDKYKLYTETPVEVIDGVISMTVSANSFVLIEIYN